MRVIGYNSQRDNYNFAGKFKAYSQCFSTCAWMFISYYALEISATDDEGLRQYIDDVEISVGSKGIAEKTIARLRLAITGYSSLWWVIQREAIEDRLWRAGIKGLARLKDGDLSINDLRLQVEKGPVILGTKKLGGLKGGHIILAVDYEEESNSLVCNDPFGNAKTDYNNINGKMVRYNLDWLLPSIKVEDYKCRGIFWESKSGGR